MPPTTTANFRLMPDPRIRNCSAIWNASSLVGVKTKENTPNGSAANDCKMGSANAAVFPDPVFADPITSCPLRIDGMQQFWISVGLVIDRLERDDISHGHTPKSSKDFISIKIKNFQW
jgi:hypothetical protein